MPAYINNMSYVRCGDQLGQTCALPRSVQPNFPTAHMSAAQQHASLSSSCGLNARSSCDRETGSERLAHAHRPTYTCTTAKHHASARTCMREASCASAPHRRRVAAASANSAKRSSTPVPQARLPVAQHPAHAATAAQRRCSVVLALRRLTALRHLRHLRQQHHRRHPGHHRHPRLLPPLHHHPLHRRPLLHRPLLLHLQAVTQSTHRAAGAGHEMLHQPLLCHAWCCPCCWHSRHCNDTSSCMLSVKACNFCTATNDCVTHNTAAAQSLQAHAVLVRCWVCAP